MTRFVFSFQHSNGSMERVGIGMIPLGRNGFADIAGDELSLCGASLDHGGKERQTACSSKSRCSITGVDTYCKHAWNVHEGLTLYRFEHNGSRSFSTQYSSLRTLDRGPLSSVPDCSPPLPLRFSVTSNLTVSILFFPFVSERDDAR